MGYLAKIIGSGMHVPDRVVSNLDLENLMDTSDEWIQQRSGISERRYVDENTQPIDLAYNASVAALGDSGIKPDEIDLIMVATLSPQHFFPGNGVFLQHRLGLNKTPAMDIRCQCSGFLYGLQTARAFIESGIYQNILLCGVEVHSRGLDFSTAGRDVSVLFGDGAGAVVLGRGCESSSSPSLRATKESSGIYDVQLHAQGEFADKLWMPNPGMSKSPFVDPADIESGVIWPQMEGRFVFKHAVTRICEVVTKILSDQGFNPDDIDQFFFHQANLRINEAVLGHLGVDASKAFNNIDKYGNCSAASIPMCLDEARKAGRVKSGDLVCCASFGSGFTWGGALLRL